VDRGVDRMWVVVKGRTEDGYIGAFDNNPGAAENLRLREGHHITFGPEHIAEIGTPPREYVMTNMEHRFLTNRAAPR